MIDRKLVAALAACGMFFTAGYLTSNLVRGQPPSVNGKDWLAWTSGDGIKSVLYPSAAAQVVPAGRELELDGVNGIVGMTGPSVTVIGHFAPRHECVSADHRTAWTGPDCL